MASQSAKKLLLIPLLVFGLGSVAEARILEGDGSGREGNMIFASPTTPVAQREPTSVWERVKGKALSWWNEKTSPVPVTPRQPASVEAKKAPTTTFDQQELKARQEQLPSYSENSLRQQVRESVTKDLNQIRDLKAIVVSQPARAAAAGLPKNKAGVVSIEFPGKKTAVKGSRKGGGVFSDPGSVPLLDIGSEAVILRSEFSIQALDFQLRKIENLKALATPELLGERELIQALGAPVEAVSDARSLKVSMFSPDGRVSMETVRGVTFKIGTEKEVILSEINLLSEEDLRLLRAEILLEAENRCHLATGLLNDLSRSTQESVAVDARFQLAQCLHKMGLFTESTRRIREQIKSADKEKTAVLLKLLIADLPKEFEDDLAGELKKLDPNAMPPELKDGYHYIIAKSAARSGHFSSAFEAAEKVSARSDKYLDAQFLAAISEYALDRKAKAYSRLKALKAQLVEKGKDKNLMSLVSINLARMAFQEKQYKEAIENFGEIKKDHGLWIDALIEQGWAQLMLGDPSGAIGNMYSIHSPYFKSVYQPESFVVRTIGYLNICQYGDAYRTLSQLEQMYRPWLAQIQTFRNQATPAKHYDAVVRYLKSGASQQNVEGVPFQVLREMGRQRDFLNLQEGINNRIDEKEQYAFIRSLVRKDIAQVQWLIKKSQERLAEYNIKIKRAEKQSEFAKELNAFRQKKSFEESVIAALEFKLKVFDESHKKFQEFEPQALARLQTKKSELQGAAGGVLKEQLKRMELRLNSMLENNELLRYETFAGSGENIRYHATSTGQSTKIAERRMPSTARPETKALKWDFDGEFWEDEIGHYKSGLKNNCPERTQAAAK